MSFDYRHRGGFTHAFGGLDAVELENLNTAAVV
jgi:hypothetical protein